MQKDYLTLGRLMKRGDHEAIKALLRNNQKDDNETFVSYMDKEIAESKYSRTQIAQRAFISRDYLYKLLRGDKKTTERDYILAICFALKLGIQKTQRALSLYPFPILDEEDERSTLIMVGLNDRVSVDEMNDCLEHCGYLALRTSPEMPSVKVGPVRSTFNQDSIVYSESERQKHFKKRRRGRSMEKINTIVTAEPHGMAPTDVFIAAEIELLDGKQTLYAQACFWPDGESFFAVDKVSMYKPEYEKSSDCIERFKTLSLATESEFFEVYLELDKLTDRKAEEYLRKIDDTRNYVFRSGVKLENGGIEEYAEFFNTTQPEYNEYLQIRKSKTRTIFSASHHSYFLRMEYGSLYETYFGDSPAEEYLFEIQSLDEIGKYSYFQPAFEKMLEIMDERMGILMNSGNKEGRNDNEK